MKQPRSFLIRRGPEDRHDHPTDWWTGSAWGALAAAWRYNVRGRFAPGFTMPPGGRWVRLSRTLEALSRQGTAARA